jgi:hypothetical protein
VTTGESVLATGVGGGVGQSIIKTLAGSGLVMVGVDRPSTTPIRQRQRGASRSTPRERLSLRVLRFARGSAASCTLRRQMLTPQGPSRRWKSTRYGRLDMPHGT